jgi:hypothetical protein
MKKLPLAAIIAGALCIASAATAETDVLTEKNSDLRMVGWFAASNSECGTAFSGSAMNYFTRKGAESEGISMEEAQERTVEAGALVLTRMKEDPPFKLQFCQRMIDAYVSN